MAESSETSEFVVEDREVAENAKSLAMRFMADALRFALDYGEPPLRRDHAMSLAADCLIRSAAAVACLSAEVGGRTPRREVFLSACGKQFDRFMAQNGERFAARQHEDTRDG